MDKDKKCKTNLIHVFAINKEQEFKSLWLKEMCNLTFLHPSWQPQLAGEARQLGCPKIVLDRMCVYYVCAHHNA